MSALADARWSWTAESFEQAAAAGAFGPEARVELFEGEVLELGSMLPGHADAVRALRALAYQVDQTNWTIGSQEPVRLGDHSEPEPDIWIARGPRRSYARRHPDESDLVLLVEVADTSLALDRDVKIPSYAAAGIEEVWLVSLPESHLTVYREPLGDQRRFGQVTILGARDTATHAATGLRVELRDVFPSN